MKFDWEPAQVGLYVSALSSAKLLFLLVVLPFGIQCLRSTTPRPEQARPVSTLYGDNHLQVVAEQQAWDREAASLKVAADSSGNCIAFISIAR